MDAANKKTTRKRVLHYHQSLKVQGDQALTAISRFAADLLHVSQAAFGWVHQDRIEVVACSGNNVAQIDCSRELIDTLVREGKIFHIQDVSSYPELENVPQSAGPGALHCIAIAPVCNSDDGHVIAALCLMDPDIRALGQQDLQHLNNLATIFSSQLELLLKAQRLEQLENQHRVLEQQLQNANEALTESEDRFRDLFDEAPIAYVHEDLDSRFIRANRTAIRTLGLKPEEVVGFVGKSLAPDSSEAQHRVEDALKHIGKGSDARGLMLELSRKDTGEPVWIEWWSRPAPDGSYTRTMFLDITDSVMLARENIQLEEQNKYLKEEIHSAHYDDIVGDNAQMQQVLADVDQVAPTTATVLVLGETGTGKELIARAVHESSQRADKPLIKVNCSALPSSLIESELFGHTKGAFTGATEKRAGRFLLADGGSIFLDEIGDLPIKLQAKLLRVLQEGEFEPLGSSQTVQVDVRVIAATNRDLFEATQEGEFREDLYFRLAVFPITLPPLRERLDDLPELANLFANKFTTRLRRDPVKLSAEEINRLSSYTWPGNVRELQNVIERALITSRNGALNLDRALPESDFLSGQKTTSPESETIRTVKELQQLEYANLVLALETTGWQVSGKGGAAELLGMNPTTLSSRIKALKITRPG